MQKSVFKTKVHFSRQNVLLCFQPIPYTAHLPVLLLTTHFSSVMSRVALPNGIEVQQSCNCCSIYLPNKSIWLLWHNIPVVPMHILTEKLIFYLSPLLLENISRVLLKGTCVQIALFCPNPTYVYAIYCIGCSLFKKVLLPDLLATIV